MSERSFEAELAELLTLAREHLRWEMELGSQGLPEHVDALPSAEPLPEPAPEPTRAVAPAAPTAPPVPPAENDALPPAEDDAPRSRRARLAVIADEAQACRACGLHRERTQAVFARGNPEARLVFVGEGPGWNEDREGLPFVGQAGQLLDKMIAAMGFSEDEVYICNVVKCRPPDNRTPNPDEIAACLPFLRRQLEVVRPEIIVALGRCAAEALGAVGPRWRGTWGSWEGVRVMPTYHPAYLLRSPEQKRPVWEDLQKVVAAMGRTLPSRRPAR